MASETKCFSVKWQIKKFISWLQKQEDILYSPEFTVETMENTKWRLSITSKCEPTLKYIALRLLREVEDGGPDLIYLDYELSFLSTDESPLKQGKFTKRFGSSTSSHELMIKKDTFLVEDRRGNLIVSCRMWRNRSSVAKNGKCFLRSVIGFESMVLHGIIENFSSLRNYSYRTVNLITSSTGISMVSFHVWVDSNDHIKFQRINYNRNFIFTGKLYILDAAGNKKGCKKAFTNPEYLPLSAHDVLCCYRLLSSIEKLTTDKFLPNDILTLQYEVAICPGIELEDVEYEYSQNDSHTELANSNVCNSEKHLDALNNIHRSEFTVEQLKAEEEQSELMTSFENDMTSMYEDHLFCDTSLQAGTETFPAHRSVLCARSPVFKKMFTTDMKEKGDERINTLDLSPEVVRRMLLFIYTDATDNLDWENAKELYFAADKYEILTLKRRCSAFIKQNLTPTSAGEILVLADRHQDDDLKSAVQDYVLKCDQEVFGSDEWKLFMERYCHLAAKVMYMKCLKK